MKESNQVWLIWTPFAYLSLSTEHPGALFGGELVLLNHKQYLITGIAIKEVGEIDFVGAVSTVDYLR